MPTTLTSPCLECKLHRQGVTKSCQECVECEKRIEYVMRSAAEAGYGVNIEKPKRKKDETIKEESATCEACCKTYSGKEIEKYFTFHFSGKRMKHCKKCMTSKMMETRNKKAEAKKNELTHQLESSDHRKKYQKLCEIAEREFRTPGNQAIYMVINGIDIGDVVQ